MTFHLISGRPDDEKYIPMFTAACNKKGITLRILDMETLDPLNLPTLSKSDILYRASILREARVIEKLLLNEECVHIYKDLFTALSSHGGSFFHHQLCGLPVVPTVPFIPKTREGVANAAEKLGGFPLIVKIVGGSLGVGVIKIDSLESLNSLLDYLRDKATNVYLRKFIEHEYYVRAVILGDKVIASHATYPVKDEFRTNLEGLGEQRREKVQLPQDTQDVAVKAAQSVGVDFAGVDLLFDAKGVPYIAEINTPFDFVCTQTVTGIDIVGQLVDFLVSKSQQ